MHHTLAYINYDDGCVLMIIILVSMNEIKMFICEIKK